MSKEILVIGHSHIGALQKAWELTANATPSYGFSFLNLRDPRYKSADKPKGVVANIDEIQRDIRAFPAPGLVAFSIMGNEHNSLGLLRDKSAFPEDTDQAKLESYFQEIEKRVSAQATNVQRVWLRLCLTEVKCPAVLLIPPPPLEEESHIRAHPGVFAARLESSVVNPPDVRLRFWKAQVQSLKNVAAEFGISVVDLPTDVSSASGLLHARFTGGDPTHANKDYGQLVIRQLVSLLETPKPNAQAKPATTGPAQPYAALPQYCFWKQSISQVAGVDVDPVTDPKFVISPSDKVATAGSCFAQHISRRLQTHGFQYMQAELPEGSPPDAKVRGFYDFSARYGNVYTARQLVQLFDRAYGYFTPMEPVWPRKGGGFCDPFRPRIEPEGFVSEGAVVADTATHLAAVRRMFESLDVFVFTLGLTECWTSKLDGSAYPLAPGVAGGEFDPEKYEFKNFTVSEVAGDLRTFIVKLKIVNPQARILLTVSPVPLVATAEDRHVLVSTTYSKAVLRVAAEEINSQFTNVCYFPSYEIITGPHAQGRYFGPDRREVVEEGVEHVMRIFMSRMTTIGTDHGGDPSDMAAIASAIDSTEKAMGALADSACDEEMLAR